MTYDFKCNKYGCIDYGKHIEITCKSSESKTQVCKHCGNPLTRLWNVPSIKTNDGYKGK